MAFLAPVGLALSAFGTIQQGFAAQQAANYQAEVARNNAIIADQNARAAKDAGMARAEAQGMKTAALAGRVKASQAASGVDVNSGSAVDVQQGTRQIGLLDAETVLHNAELDAYGYRTTAQNYRAQADLDEMKGRNSLTGSFFNAAGGLLSKASGISWV